MSSQKSKARNVVIAVAILLLLLWLLLRSSPEIPKVSFLVPEETMVARDYNQRVFIPIQNSGPGIARLRLESTHFPDLPAGFVGKGTPDWKVPDTVFEIPEGEVWEAPLLIHGNRAEKDAYTLELTATHEGVDAANAEFPFELTKPKLELETEWISPDSEVDRARLVKILKIRNVGAPVPNLSVGFSPAENSSSRLVFDPVVEELRLTEGEEISVSIHPYLYPTFSSIEGILVLSGLNQEIPVAYRAEVPEGKKVFVTLSRSSSRSGNSGNRCTNSPGSSYTHPGSTGTPGRSGWQDSGGGSGFGGGSSGGGTLVTGDMNGPSDEPEEPEEPEEEESEEEEGVTLNLFDTWITEGETAGEGEDSDGEADSDENPDNGSFGYLEGNSEGAMNGFISPEAIGRVIGEGFYPHDEDAYNMPLVGSMYSGPVDENGVPIDAITTFGPKKKKKDEKESSTHADKDGNRTHMTRRVRKDGAQFINFGWGISNYSKRLGGGRKTIGYSGKGNTGRPRLGPNPRPGAPSLATYVKEKEDGKKVIETFDPELGKSVELSDPEKDADSPIPLEAEDGVETLFREDGEVKRVSLDESLAPAPSNQWPAGEKTGPIISATRSPNNEVAMVTREPGGGVALRQPNSTKNFDATGAALASLGKELILALKDDEGRVRVADPQTGETVHELPGSGYRTPALTPTDDGGLRMMVSKPLPEPGSIPKDGAGPDLGGAFAVDYKDGEWGEPRRVFMPDAPVEDAAVAVEFTPKFGDAHYKPMNTDISFNDRKLHSIEDEVPFGRYVIKVPTSALNYQSPTLPDEENPNTVRIDAEGIGPGNFHMVDNSTVYGLHELCQECLVATDGDDADRIAQIGNQHLRHGKPDLILASNGAQLPRDLQPGQSLTMTMSAFNAGDVPTPEGKVEVFFGQELLGVGNLPSLPSFDGALIEFAFQAPELWKPGESLEITLIAPSEGDADPSNNRLSLFLLKEFSESDQPPEAPARIDVANLPETVITDVPARPADSPLVAPLAYDRLWFRCEIPAEGNLQVEVVGSGAPLVDRIDLFDAEGRAIKKDDGKWRTTGPHLFVRVGLIPNQSLPSNTSIKIWWE